jgi:hypothetical protein
MVPTGTSINKLALDLDVAPNSILEIVKGKRHRGGHGASARAVSRYDA